MGSRENKVERYLNTQFELRGGFTRKWTAPGHSFVPDRIGFLPGGIVWFVEVKTHDGTLSSGQQRELDRLRELGMNVEVVYGLNDVDVLMKEIDNG